MWSEENKNKLYKELEVQLDNKKFFNAKDYYNTYSPKEEKVNIDKNVVRANYIEENYDYAKTIKGISFSNKLELNENVKSINSLSLEEMKIYKISDLLSANLEETIVIPYNAKPVSLALIKKYDWKDIFFGDVGTAFGILKDKLKMK